MTYKKCGVYRTFTWTHKGIETTGMIISDVMYTYPPYTYYVYIIHFTILLYLLMSNPEDNNFSFSHWKIGFFFYSNNF